MAKKRTPPSLKFQLIEDADQVRLLIVDEDVAVLDFENTEPPAVRVVGFNNRQNQEEEISSFVRRETASFSNELSALNALITSHENQVYKKAILLRREARKLAILGHTLRAAKCARARLQSEGK